MIAARVPAAVRSLALAAAMAVLAAPAVTAAEACASLPGHQPLPQAAQPQNLADPLWQARVAEIERGLTAAGTGQTQLLFLGDSLVQSWAPPIFENFYGHRAPLNLGVNGDYTQGLLWRLARMPLGSVLRPKLVVILIGTNNTASGSRPEDTALGIAEVVRHIQRHSPQSRVLLVGLLPRGAAPGDPLRAVNERVNALIAHCADNRTVFYATPGTMLPDGAGRLSDQISFDQLHLTWLGYGVLSAALEPEIRRLMGN